MFESKHQPKSSLKMRFVLAGRKMDLIIGGWVKRFGRHLSRTARPIVFFRTLIKDQIF